MDTKRRKPELILTIILKCLVYPATRLRKLSKKPHSKHFKIYITVLVLVMGIISLLFLLWSRSTSDLLLKNSGNILIVNGITTEMYIKDSPMRQVPLNKIYKNVQDDNDTLGMMSDRRQVNMLDTPGCRIPIAMIEYRKYLKNKSNTSVCKNSCGQRALFLYRESGNKIRVYVDSLIMKQYLSYGAKYYCCYRSMGSRDAIKNKHAGYSVCRRIEHGSIYKLESDFVNVNCFEYDYQNISYRFYDDFYVFTKKIKINNGEKQCDMNYNVLMIGINSMSLPRIVQSMPRTVKFLKENFWLGFRGYHKIGDNTLPNLMAVLTAQNISIWNKCAEKMDKCRDFFVWSKFKEDGYVTGLGEDSTSIRNKFNHKFLSFEKLRTDHYIHPFFLTSEMKSKHKSILCSGKISFGQQLLNYALDFANTYKKQRFFGVFWMNSYSSDVNNCPQDNDKMFENFFYKLSYTGSLVNTFVIFLSDHGIRYGDQRMKVESYYDERMPFLFMWVPTFFRGSHHKKLRFLIINQFRLVTPYDLYETLTEIKNISACHSSTNSVSNPGLVSQSIFNEISENRTCDDARIHMKWCSCHNLYPLTIQDNDGVKTVAGVISFINSFLKSAQTEKCQICLRLSLKKIIRMHFYYNKDKVSLFYVVAFTLVPGDMTYEATVSRKGDKIDVIGPISVISTYRNIGRCALKPRDRMFCVCKNVQNCTSY